MTKPVLVISEPAGVSETALQMLSKVMRLQLGPYSRQALCNETAEATGMMIRLGHRIDADLLGVAKKLRFIASPTTGLNHVDLDAAKQAQVEILSLKGERVFLDGIHATAEHSWGLLLSLLRRIHAKFDISFAYGKISSCSGVSFDSENSKRGFSQTAQSTVPRACPCPWGIFFESVILAVFDG